MKENNIEEQKRTLTWIKASFNVISVSDDSGFYDDKVLLIVHSLPYVSLWGSLNPIEHSDVSYYTFWCVVSLSIFTNL